ncbi:MAG: pyruvate kinase [Armatimonadota bacterium]|nr:pyruvate kinase [Armatimonadota bacterium]MDR7449571.1 pyruvate kinase [Armatimonadota bacterium]MDR7460202.1 pyruvate kinase [Armatimonadota bacterium]MDR7480289.1 pyruvate kinase [Armatimonadota bacterium]MDR7489147.1 pyruvate kinase [Armatimonadota bacterium]
MESVRRQTKIVATLGPACTAPDVLRALLEAGLDVARLNFSYGTPDDHLRALEALCAAEAETGRRVAVLQDLPGPKLRTGRLPCGSLLLRPGDVVRLAATPQASGDGVIPVHYPALSQDVRPGHRIYLQDGEIVLEVVAVEAATVAGRVVHGGTLRQHAGINLPGVPLSVPTVTEEDFRHLDLGLAQRVDYVALSFVEGPEDLHRVRAYIDRRGGGARLVAKIERRRALERIDEIIEAADAVMVARGDLAVETAPEEVPVLQKRLIAACHRRGRPVITATQMLESMIVHPRPTRAEATDVANAVFDGTDALMLSGETAIGAYPVEAVRTMARIAEHAEGAVPPEVVQRWREQALRDGLAARDTAEAIALAAVQAAEALGAAAIVAATTSGSTALRVARFRPRRPILGVTTVEATLRRLRLVWGVHPVLVPEIPDLDALVAAAVEAAKREGFVRRGDDIVVTAGYPMGRPGTTNLLKVVRV